MKENRTFSFIILFISYVVATILGIFVFKLDISSSFYLNVFIADIVATVFIYLIGILFKNASVYDPYWSVAPLVIIPLVIYYFERFNIGIILIFIVVIYWGVRLTLNWAYTFKNLNEQDWRYTMIKEKTNNLYQLVSLLGIHIMPTVIVYLVMLPVLFYIKNLEFSVFNVIGFVISLIAVTIQLIADYQLHRFRKTNKDKLRTINVGLWRLSRHPNYFGEIMMWWGIYILTLASDIKNWYLLIGPLANTLMFLFISIPMQEKRLLTYKESYVDYMDTTNKLVPWFTSK